MFALASRWLALFEDVAMVTSMALVTSLISIQVFLRYVLNDSLPWAEELVRYTVVWMSFIGAGMGIRRGAHIAVAIGIQLLPSRIAKLLSMAGLTLGLAFAVLLTVYGAKLVLHVGGFGQLSSAMRVPMAAVYACLPLGGMLLFFRFAEALLALLQPSKAAGHSGSSELEWTGGL
ncbi:MAG: TRAP transporter small permease [Alphaproteobacteria bacterium]|nr:TRAP transporter small permease [Alphaproteobacteria bacterium]